MTFTPARRPVGSEICIPFAWCTGIVMIVIEDFERLPRAGDTTYGFAVGLYPIHDYPTLPTPSEDA